MNFKTFFFFFIILFSFYQDFPLSNIFGEIARTPIVFCLPIFFIYFVLNPSIKLSKYSKYFMLYTLYLILISIIHIVFLAITKQKIYFLQENILLKCLKMIMYPFIIFIYYQFIYSFLNKNESRFNILFKVLTSLKIILVLYMIFEIYYLKTNYPFMSFLHSSNNKYWRIRLITYEESWIGSIVTIISFTTIYLSRYLDKNRATKLLTLFISIFFIICYTFYSESKGYLLLFLVSVLPLLIKSLYVNKKTRNFLFIGIGFVILTGIYVFFSLYNKVSEQLYSSITFGTRFGSYVAVANNFIYHPFGVGFGSHLHYYTDSIRTIIESPLMINFNLNEIKQYLQTTKSLSAKTYFFNNLVFGGIPFLLFYYLFFIRRYYSIAKIQADNLSLIKIPLIFIILSSFVYITLEIKYEVWFFLAFIDVLSNKFKNKRIE